MSDDLTVLALLALVLAGPVLLVANIFTLAEVLSVPPHAWTAADVNRGRWTALAGASVLLLPLGLVTSTWWGLRIRARLEQAAPGSTRTVFRRRATVFEAATTWPARLSRVVLVTLAAIGLALGMPKLLHAAVGDPSHVSVGNMNHDIAPKTWIEQHCTGSVVRALHLDNPAVEENGHDYQRWTVLPKPGHVDRVLLDLDSGTVICP